MGFGASPNIKYQRKMPSVRAFFVTFPYVPTFCGSIFAYRVYYKTDFDRKHLKLFVYFGGVGAAQNIIYAYVIKISQQK